MFREEEADRNEWEESANATAHKPNWSWENWEAWAEIGEEGVEGSFAG
jgi:hypothetical protein